MGFPKNDNFVGNIEMAQKIQTSQFCFIEKAIYLENSEFENIQCKNQINASPENDKYQIYQNDINHKPLNLLFILFNISCVIYLIFNNRLVK